MAEGEKLPDGLVVAAVVAIVLGVLGVLADLAMGGLLAAAMGLVVTQAADLSALPGLRGADVVVGLGLALSALCTVAGLFLSGLCVYGGVRALSSRDVHWLERAAWWSFGYVVAIDLVFMPAVGAIQYLLPAMGEFQQDDLFGFAVIGVRTLIGWLWSAMLAGVWYVIHINAERHLDAA